MIIRLLFTSLESILRKTLLFAYKMGLTALFTLLRSSSCCNPNISESLALSGSQNGVQYCICDVCARTDPVASPLSFMQPLTLLVQLLQLITVSTDCIAILGSINQCRSDCIYLLTQIRFVCRRHQVHVAASIS